MFCTDPSTVRRRLKAFHFAKVATFFAPCEGLSLSEIANSLTDRYFFNEIICDPSLLISSPFAILYRTG